MAAMDWLSSKMKPHGWTASAENDFHKSATFMDYLHGDVKDEDAELACLYEYARESKNMWDAAKLLANARASGQLKGEKDFWRIHCDFEGWIQVTDWTTYLLMCESFPKQDWNGLTKTEREKILRFERRKVEPLPVERLHYGPLKKKKGGGFSDFAEFDQLAAQTKPVIKDVRPGEQQEPIKMTDAMVQKSGAVYYCLFIVDFSQSKNRLNDRFWAWLNQDEINKLWQGHKKQRKGKTRNALRPTKIVQLLGWRDSSHKCYLSSHWCLFEVDLSARKGDLTRQFNKWLELPENKARLKLYNLEKRGTADKWKDRLKDLAAWRLYREHGHSCDKANQFASDHRKKFKNWPEIHRTCKKVKGKWPYKPDDPRPFRDAKQTGNDAANTAPPFSCDDDYRHAKSEAKKFLTNQIPSDEFKKMSPQMKVLLAVFE